jgi:hypothetical protein
LFTPRLPSPSRSAGRRAVTSGGLPPGSFSRGPASSKHDSFIARKNGAQVKLYSRPGNDLTRSFSLIVDALARLRSRSCIIDGEAVACDESGVPRFFADKPRSLNESPGPRMPGLCGQLSAHFMRGCRRAPLVLHPTPIDSGSLCKIAHST